MCEACTIIRDGEVVESLRLADALRGTYRRALTVIELEHGDVDRVRADMDAAEARVVTAAKGIIAKITDQLIDEARPLVESGDVAGAARVKPSYTAELTAALAKASAAAVRAGKRQVLDSARKQGVTLAAKPPAKKDVKKAQQYLDAKMQAISEQVQAQIDASVKRIVLAAAATEVFDDEVATQIKDAAARSLVASAYSVARESYATGRLFGYDEVKSDVAEIMYTAILDDNACDVCLDADGQTWVADEGDDMDEGFASAPNLNCLGGDRCRCYTVLVMR